MISVSNSNRYAKEVWFIAKINIQSGKVVDVQIGKTTDTDTTKVGTQG